MTTVLALIIVLSMSNGPRPDLAVWSKNNNGPQPFSLALSATQELVKSGSPVDIEVTTTNLSPDAITFSQSNPGMQYDFDVRGPTGKPVPERDMLRKIKSLKDGLIRRMTRKVLAPGGSFRETVRISDYFDMASSGNYSIRLRRVVPGRPGNVSVKSNVISVTITP